MPTLHDAPSASTDMPLKDSSEATPIKTIDIVDISDKTAQIPARINSSSLTGLRGIMAMYIMVFHTLFFSSLNVDILGSVLMSLFFLLSGFTFGIAEVNRTYIRGKCCSQLCTKQSTARHFIQRRFARTLPLFWLTNIIAIPATIYGSSWFQNEIQIIVTGIATLFAVNTWFIMPLLFNGPAWFVSTIWFYYWLFPCIYPRVKAYTTVQKRRWIVIHAWLQFFIPILLSFVFLSLGVSSGYTFLMSTFWPVSRLPVWIMGLLAGILRSEGLSMTKKGEQWNTNQWKKCTDRLAVLLVVLMTAGSAVQNIFELETSFNFWMQIILPFWHLLFIFSLTMHEMNDDNKENNAESWTKRILSSKVCMWLGQLSYAVYLVHEPVRYYVVWIVNGAAGVIPDCDLNEDDDCLEEMEAWAEKGYLLVWCIPIVWVITMIVSIVLHKWFEKPMRAWLRPSVQQ